MLISKKRRRPKKKAWKRIHSWQSNFLSRGGKEILIKSVVQAISSYLMSVFFIPVLFCEELESVKNIEKIEIVY